jgi:hypothetical protein
MTEIGRITGQDIETNRDSDSPGRVLQVELSGVDDVQACELFTQDGDDTSPVKDSMCLVVTVSDALKIVVAVTDGLEPEVEEGEREFYSQASGVKKARMYLTKDGKAIFNRSSRLVARKDDETESNFIIDETFWTWINSVASALGITPPPQKLVSKISEGTDKVLVP